jgi:Fe-S-cluster-containing hydrogenase component 2
MKRYEQTGVLSKKDLVLPTKKHLQKGVAISECIQLIPCNPCVESCPVDAISMKDINSIPVIDYDRCISCGKCISVCPGLALFIVKKTDEKGYVTLPYELYPLPKKGQDVEVLDRQGKTIGRGIVSNVKKTGKTMIVTVEVNRNQVMDIRNIRVIDEA